MKINLNEYSGSFSIDMAAETVADSALLARLKTNSTQKTKIYAQAFSDGTFTGTVIIKKVRRIRNEIE